jgi:hypothetical protein
MNLQKEKECLQILNENREFLHNYIEKVKCLLNY